MSAVVKIIPKAQRLRVSAIYDHETVEYEGDIFKLLEQLIQERRTGKGTFSLNQGDVYKLEFDFRGKKRLT